MSQLQQYLDAHLKTINSKLDLDAIGVYTINHKKEVAQLIAFAGERPRLEVPFGVGPIGECAQWGEGATRKTKRPLDAGKYQGQIILPIKIEERHVGILVCSSSKLDFYDDKRRILEAQALADHCAELWAMELPPTTIP